VRACGSVVIVVRWDCMTGCADQEENNDSVHMPPGRSYCERNNMSRDPPHSIHLPLPIISHCLAGP